LVVEERVFVGMGSAFASAEGSVCPGLDCHEFMSPYYDKLFQIKHNISIFPKFSSTIMPVTGIFHSTGSGELSQLFRSPLSITLMFSEA
jgi:hypothetical protein